MKFRVKYLSFIGILIFIYLIFNIDLNQLMIYLKKANWFFVIIAFIFSLLALIINFLRWRYILNYFGVTLSKKEAIIYSLKSLYAENTPGKLGEPILKAAYLKEDKKEDFSILLFSSFLHKLIDIWTASIEAIFSIIILFFLFNFNIEIIFFLIIIFVFFSMFFYLIKKEKLVKFFYYPFSFILPSYFKKEKSWIKKVYENLKKINNKFLLTCLVYDLISVLFFALCFYFIIYSLEYHINFIYMILVVPLTTIVIGIPISIAGLGPREALFYYYFNLVGLNGEIGIFVGLLSFLFRIITIIPGLILSFLERNKYF